MNKQFELFLLKVCELHDIDEEGTMFFSVNPSTYFHCNRYAEGVPRTEESELDLFINIDKRNNVNLILYSEATDALDETSLSFVNATLENVSKWLKTANTRAAKPFASEELAA